MNAFYEGIADQLDELYDKLVKTVRRRQRSSALRPIQIWATAV